MTDNVVDLAAIRKKQAELKATAQHVKTGKAKLTKHELSTALLQSTDLIEEQYELLQAMSTDILKLADTYSKMQHQMMLISGQAYLALDMMKAKGLCTSEEVQSRWEVIVNEKMSDARAQEDRPVIISPHEGRVTDPTGKIILD